MAAVRARRPGKRGAEPPPRGKRRPPPVPAYESMPRIARIKLSGGLQGDDVQVSGKSLALALTGFVMFVGILIGTYSSIYTACPFALLWEQLFGVQGKWRKGKPSSLSRGSDGRAEPPPRIEPKTGEAPPRRTRPARRRA